MATTIKEVQKYLYEEGVKFKSKEDSSDLGIVFGMENYRDTEGDDGLLIIVSLLEDGEYIKIFAPKAFAVPEHRVDIFCQACVTFQMMTPTIQFEFTPSDGLMHPCIEFPLEDALLTKSQLLRCVRSLASHIDNVYQDFQKIIETGVINFDYFQGNKIGGGLADMLANMPAELRAKIIEEAMKKAGDGGAS